MRDANQEYPLRQPQRGEHHPFDDDTDEEDILDEEPQLPGGPVHQRGQATHLDLPIGRVRKMLTISLAAGILAAVLNIVFTLVNSPLYKTAATKGTGLDLSTASAIVGLFCLTWFISLVFYFIAGFVTGKVAVDRRLGFFCGFLASAITQVIGFVVGQLPGYPGKLNTGFSSNLLNIGGALIVALVLLLLVALLGGLVGFLGARLSTRRNPYYVGYDV